MPAPHALVKQPKSQLLQLPRLGHYLRGINWRNIVRQKWCDPQYAIAKLGVMRFTGGALCA